MENHAKDLYTLRKEHDTHNRNVKRANAAGRCQEEAEHATRLYSDLYRSRYAMRERLVSIDSGAVYDPASATLIKYCYNVLYNLGDEPHFYGRLVKFNKPK